MINDVFNNKVITVYNIENLDKKLKGELPVTREDLFELTSLLSMNISLNAKD